MRMASGGVWMGLVAVAIAWLAGARLNLLGGRVPRGHREGDEDGKHGEGGVNHRDLLRLVTLSRCGEEERGGLVGTRFIER